jgi:hypothetical protein
MNKITEKQIKRYVLNRRLKELQVKDNNIVLTLTDNRRILINRKSGSIRIKSGDEYMSERDLERFNDQVEAAVKRAQANIPAECRNCGPQL